MQETWLEAKTANQFTKVTMWANFYTEWDLFGSLVKYVQEDCMTVSAKAPLKEKFAWTIMNNI